MREMSTWIVKSGTVYSVNSCDIHNELKRLGCDSDNDYDWIVARASTKQDALAIADLFDSGFVDYDNYACQICGKTHSAVYFKSKSLDEAE